MKIVALFLLLAGWTIALAAVALQGEHRAEFALGLHWPGRADLRQALPRWLPRLKPWKQKN